MAQMLVRLRSAAGCRRRCSRRSAPSSLSAVTALARPRRPEGRISTRRSGERECGGARPERARPGSTGGVSDHAADRADRPRRSGAPRRATVGRACSSSAGQAWRTGHAARPEAGVELRRVKPQARRSSDGAGRRATYRLRLARGAPSSPSTSSRPTSATGQLLRRSRARDREASSACPRAGLGRASGPVRSGGIPSIATGASGRRVCTEMRTTLKRGVGRGAGPNGTNGHAVFPPGRSAPSRATSSRRRPAHAVSACSAGSSSRRCSC